MSEHEMRTVANTLAAVGLSWNPAGRKPADMYREMADRLADAGLLQSPETAAEHERTRVERDRYRTAWRRARTRALSAGGAADRYAARARDGQEAVQHMLFTVIGGQLARKAAQKEAAELREQVTELVRQRDRIADDTVKALAAAPEELTVFRASHGSITFGLYTTREAARAHCETYLRREIGDTEPLTWVPDYSGDQVVEELSYIGASDDDPAMDLTGYVVTPLTVASAYDEEADE